MSAEEIRAYSTLIASLAAAFCSIWAATKAKKAEATSLETHKIVNNELAIWKALAVKAAIAEGIVAGVAKERAEQKVREETIEAKTITAKINDQ